MVPSANVELVRKGFAAMARGDYETVAELLDPQVRWHGPDPAFGCHNRDEALAFMQRPERPPLGRLVDIIEAGPERLVVVTQPPVEPSGELPPRRANVTTVRAGRVVEMIAYESPEDACLAAGVPRPSPAG